MRSDPGSTQAHYETLLARNYCWMAGGMEDNVRKNWEFFSRQGIIPTGSGTAIDLGAGCGFQSLALAETGFSVIAVDFCRPLLDQLRDQSAGSSVRILCTDILAFPSWAGLKPELIACMGDTLTHLPDIPAVQDLISHSARELDPGGRIVLAFRDYSREPPGTLAVIPVRRDTDRIFLCRLEYEPSTVRVTDILYTRETGVWERTGGTYRKLRIGPGQVAAMLAGANLTVKAPETWGGYTTIIAIKDR